MQWWIETRTYSGTGRMQDGKLVVKWGEETPVIYTLQPGGKLNGTWAGGKANDRLTLYAGGTTAPVRVHLGSYSAEGTEPGGRRYKAPQPSPALTTVTISSGASITPQTPATARSSATSSSSPGTTSNPSSTRRARMAASSDCGHRVPATKR